MTIGGKDRYAKMGNLGVTETTRILDALRDAGVTTIDTADAYSFGGSEEILGQALKGRRHEFVLVTKVFMRMGPAPHDIGLSRKHLMEGCEASLRRLQTDYLDLYISHQPDQFVPVDETMRAFDDLVRQGKVRYIGCSNHSSWHVMKALGVSERHGFVRYECQQVNYSLVSRDVEREIVPLGDASVDEGPRRGTSLEKMAQLPPLTEGGRLTAAVASQISDGAGAVLLMTADKANALGLTPLARVVDTCLVGVDPVLMLTGPIDATHRLLERTKMSMRDIDVVEINEAFA